MSKVKNIELIGRATLVSGGGAVMTQKRLVVSRSGRVVEISIDDPEFWSNIFGMIIDELRR